MTKTSAQNTNAILLTKLFHQCKILGLVSSQYEFSNLCGRKRSWYSSTRCRNVPISTDAAVILSVRLEKCAREDLGHELRPHAEYLSELLMAVVRERVEAELC